MQIDCEAITDPHSQLETPGTVVIASQGTQACGDELVVTGTSEGMPKGTQDTQAGSLKMVGFRWAHTKCFGELSLTE